VASVAGLLVTSSFAALAGTPSTLMTVDGGKINWRLDYNECRRHSSLNYQTPSEFSAG
jgi:hypothetical protein